MTPVLLAAMLVAQSPSTESIDAVQLELIRKALAEAPALHVERANDSADRPVFRLVIEARQPVTPAWSTGTTIPSYVRPRSTAYHYEFLQQVTPEQSRASTLYPVGVDIVPLLKALIKSTRAEMRRREEERARREVRQALDDLARARTAANK